MARTRRRYTDHDRATTLAALQSNNGNVSRTSRETGISMTTIRDWRDDPHPDLAELREEKREALSQVWDRVARAYLERALDPQALRDSNGQSAITAAAIATDKLQLLQGRPTEIAKHEHQSIEVSDRAAEAAATALQRRGNLN